MVDIILPHRILQHEIDTEACKIVSSKFDRSWELRDLTGRDFGIDKIAERFQDGYSTSELLLLQIKGTEKAIDTENPKFSLETKELQYAEMFSDPVLLIYVSITNPTQCYYVWLQQYIRIRLNYDNPDWRQQETNTIYIPKRNLLDFKLNGNHLNYISAYPKFQNAWIQYYVALSDLDYYFQGTPYIDQPLNMEYYFKQLKSLKQAIQNAQNVIFNIPDWFIPDELFSTIPIIDEIESSGDSEQCFKKNLSTLIRNIEQLKSSLVLMAMIFSPDHLRLLYEHDNTQIDY